MKKITFGSDPEFMLQNTDGKLISAIGIVPGTKEMRYDLGDGHACYYDNVLTECQIAPSKSIDEAIAHYRECFQRTAGVIAPHKLLVQASANYPESECEHEDAKQFGCNPEFDAYLVEVVQPPICTTTFRSGGGHVHMGYNGGKNITEGFSDHEIEERNNKIGWDRLWIARMCDIFLGVPSLFLDRDPTSKKRRQLYGGAGAHRPCENYGLEYRTLSNFWVASPKLVEVVYLLSQLCVSLVMDSQVQEKIWEKYVKPEQLQQCINTWNTKDATKIWTSVEKFVPETVQEKFIREIENTKKYDFYKEWNIKV